MSKKSRERRKARLEGKDQPEGKPSTTSEALRRRRNRRLMFVALIGVSFPILELIAYRYRVITITLVNKSSQPALKARVTYAGGSFETEELKPGGSITRAVRPDYSFQRSTFATYPVEVRYSTPNGGIIRQAGRIGTIDFSAHETYTIEPSPMDVATQIRHTTSPGFPLSLIRDLMGKLGNG